MDVSLLLTPEILLAQRLRQRRNHRPGRRLAPAGQAVIDPSPPGEGRDASGERTRDDYVPPRDVHRAGCRGLRSPSGGRLPTEEDRSVRIRCSRNYDGHAARMLARREGSLPIHCLGWAIRRRQTQYVLFVSSSQASLFCRPRAALSIRKCDACLFAAACFPSADDPEAKSPGVMSEPRILCKSEPMLHAKADSPEGQPCLLAPHRTGRYIRYIIDITNTDDEYLTFQQRCVLDG